MFRSDRRAIVFPQAEHARLAGAIAQVWGNEHVARPPVPFDAFVRAVAFHDRGYGQLDDDGIGEVPAERWLAIQRAGLEPTDDPVVDLLVAQHVRRLVASPWSSAGPAALAGFDALLTELHASATGVDPADAAEADRVMDLCDRIAFEFCLERPAAGRIEICPSRGSPPLAIAYRVDGMGLIGLDPWPLAIARLDGFVLAFAATGYPGRLDPVLVPFRAVADSGH